MINPAYRHHSALQDQECTYSAIGIMAAGSEDIPGEKQTYTQINLFPVGSLGILSSTAQLQHIIFLYSYKTDS